MVNIVIVNFTVRIAVISMAVNIVIVNIPVGIVVIISHIIVIGSVGQSEAEIINDVSNSLIIQLWYLRILQL